MKPLIACCGIDCENCNARIATLNNDNELREQTAKLWGEMYQAPHINAASINCMGCRSEGPVFDYCIVCEIRKCATAKGFATCGECSELDTCESVGYVILNVPEAKANLLG
jgi:hypothetical protein